MENYRDTRSKGEILNTFSVSNPYESVMWQTVGGLRSIFEIEDIKINTTIRTAKLTLKDEHAIIDPGQPIYLKLSKNASIMKLRCLSNSYNEISIVLPDQMKSIENRTSPRIRFSPADERIATIVLTSEFTKSSTQALKFKLMDISQTGLSLIVSDENKELLIRSNGHYLTHLGENELATPIALDFKYLKNHTVKLRGRSYRTNRAGLMLSNGISKDALTAFANSK
jgi:hypothetical protein